MLGHLAREVGIVQRCLQTSSKTLAHVAATIYRICMYHSCQAHTSNMPNMHLDACNEIGLVGADWDILGAGLEARVEPAVAENMIPACPSAEVATHHPPSDVYCSPPATNTYPHYPKPLPTAAGGIG